MIISQYKLDQIEVVIKKDKLQEVIPFQVAFL